MSWLINIAVQLISSHSCSQITNQCNQLLYVNVQMFLHSRMKNKLWYACSSFNQARKELCQCQPERSDTDSALHEITPHKQKSPFTWYILSHMKVWPPSISSVCPALRGRAQGLVTTPSFWRIFFLHCIASSTMDLQNSQHISWSLLIGWWVWQNHSC